jgi:hypothetical protein
MYAGLRNTSARRLWLRMYLTGAGSRSRASRLPHCVLGLIFGCFQKVAVDFVLAGINSS